MDTNDNVLMLNTVKCNTKLLHGLYTEFRCVLSYVLVSFVHRI